MKRFRRPSPPPSRRAVLWLAAGIFASVALLLWFGYRGVEEWQHSSSQLSDRRSSEAADLLLKALTRDMRGAQETVLNAREWDQYSVDRPSEVSNLVASAFARYPYPESFFAWDGSSGSSAVTFFNRADRLPVWSPADESHLRFPVVLARSPTVADALLTRLIPEVRAGASAAAFHVSVDGTPYQVVAQFIYRDPYREQLAAVAGFTVNLEWIRQNYFGELARQVWEIGPMATEELAMTLADPNHRVVAGTMPSRDAVADPRKFSLMFYNPDQVPGLASATSSEWTITVGPRHDAALLNATQAANRMLALAAASACILAIGLIMAARAELLTAQLSALRSDFVSAVTHELKTPIATIRAAAETVSRGRVSDEGSFQTYGRLVLGESKRLARLVDNLLAYARITDVADVYTFERIEVDALFEEIEHEFQAQLAEAGVTVIIDTPPAVVAVHGDRLALRLLFDNLIDNAIKYSDRGRKIVLRVRSETKMAALDVEDNGAGIPANEIDEVVKRFRRGRRTSGHGSGLGLAIAERIATDHGGSLTIRSTVGVGTTVTVRLPGVNGHRSPLDETRRMT
jgi:signal transduction histidine kinase